MDIGAGRPFESKEWQLALLQCINRAAGSRFRLDQMLSHLIRLVEEVTHCDACLVYLIDKSAGELVLCASQLPHAGEIGNIRMSVCEGMTGWVVRHQSVVALASKPCSDPRFKSFPSLPEDTYEAFLSVPLITDGDVIGVINVHHKQPRNHTAPEVALVSYVAEQMGSAIGKAQLFDASHRLPDLSKSGW
jgi:signal transduction protein with GAF and PtsI domain